MGAIPKVHHDQRIYYFIIPPENELNNSLKKRVLPLIRSSLTIEFQARFKEGRAVVVDVQERIINHKHVTLTCIRVSRELLEKVDKVSSISLLDDQGNDKRLGGDFCFYPLTRNLDIQPNPVGAAG